MPHKWMCKIVVLLLFFMVLPAVSQTQTGLTSFASKDTIYVSAEHSPRIPEFNSIAARMPIPMAQTPAAVGVVTGQVMEDQGSLQLADAVGNFSGVNPQTGFGTHEYFMIRGFDTEQTGLLMTDGTPEPISTIYNMYNIARVEVLKGPGAFLYGGRAMSGSINMVRKQAQLQNYAGATLSGGSFNTMRGDVDINISNETNLAFRLNAMYQGSDGYRDDMDSKVYAINPALSWQPSKQSRLDLNYEYVDSRYQPDSGLPLVYHMDLASSLMSAYKLTGIADVDRTNSYQTPYDDSKQVLSRFKLLFNHKFSDVLSVNERFWVTNQQWDSQGTLLNGAFDTGYGSYMVNRSMNILDDRQIIVGNQAELAYKMNLGAMNYQLVTGVEISRFTDEYSIDVIQQLPMLDLENPVDPFNGNLSDAFRYQEGDAETVTLAPYLLNVIELPVGVNVMFGGRYDHMTFKDDLRNDDREYNQFSPMLGVGYTPVSAVYLYANAGSAFSPPSVRVVGDRDPEESTQYEAGIKLNLLNDRIMPSLAVFSMERKNMAIPDASGVTGQNGTQESRGIEFDVTARMTDHCTSFFSYTYTDAELTEFTEMQQVGTTEVGYPIIQFYDYSGNVSAFAPEHMVNFWHYRQFGPFNLGVGIRYVSDQYIYANNEFQIDSYTTLNASASYQLGDYKLFLHAKNLTDTEYEMRGFGATSVIPAAPLTITGGIDFSLDSF